jgi:hypothetical protein
MHIKPELQLEPFYTRENVLIISKKYNVLNMGLENFNK